MTIPRLYPILDTGALRDRAIDDWAAVANQWLDAGAGILQIRHKESWTRADFAKATQIRDDCARSGAALVVNDRSDMAALLDAGLHVGQDDLPPSTCRRLVGDRALLGYSTHNAVQLEAGDREPVDYLAFGPVFVTFSKRQPDTIVGLAGLRAARALTSKPLIAIGGITQANAQQVFDAGADSVAVISALIPGNGDTTTFGKRMEQWQRLTGR